MQRRLIRHGTSQQRVAVLFQREGQAPELLCPLQTQMAQEPDSVNHFRRWIDSFARSRWHPF